MRSILFSFIILTSIFVISSCGSEIDTYSSDTTGPQYFPLEIGNTWIYSVDSILYDNRGNRVDTNHHIIKEIITGTFKGADDITNYTIERFEANGANWIKTNNWYATINNSQAIRNEENLRFIRMVFPVSKGKRWDGNAHIDTDNMIVKIAGEPIKMYQNWTYRYTDVFKFETIGDIDYNKVHTIEECDTETSISKRYSLAKYAEGVGLVYRKMMILNTQKSENIPWEEKAEEGFILEQTLISFTK